MSFLWLFAFNQIFIVYGNLVNFQEGYEYVYDYDGSTQMPNVATFFVKGKIGIIPHNKSKSGNQECLLYVHNYYISVKTSHTDHSLDLGLDLTKSLLFDITPHGEVVSIKYPKDENSVVIFLKKSLLGALSSKLLVTPETLKGNSEWSYQINETGHDGKNEVTYNVKKSNDELIFKRIKRFTEVPNAKGNREKILHYHPNLGVPHLIKIADSYQGPTEASSDYNPHERLPGDPKNVLHDKDRNFKIPPMNAEGKSALKFLEQRQLKRHIVIKRSDILEDTLMISKYPEFKAALNVLEDDIKSNLTCVRTIKDHLNQTRNSCFVMLAKLLKQISNEDINKVAETYLNETLTDPEDIENMAIIGDAFGVVASEQTLYYLTEKILLARKPNFHLIMSALAQFIVLYQPPPKLFLETIELKNFKSPYKLSDAFETKLLNDRVLLVLGAVIHEMMKFDPKWSKQMTEKLESTLKIFDPWHHRQMRSVLSDEEFDDEIEKKSLFILSLGNAAAESSRDYFKSYMNTSESPSLLRRSSLRALTAMHDPQAADLLLVAAITDADEHVRYDAKKLYQTHPFGIKVHYTENEVIPDLMNLTSAQADNHVRRIRSISAVVRRIFQGFQYKIQLPGVDWKKQIGSNDIGASFGLQIKNQLDVDIKPLKGFLRVDVHDEVFAIANLGFIKKQIKLISAELCFKGGIEYEFNILGEFSVDEIIDLVKSFDKVIPNLIRLIKNNIKRFKDMIDSFGKTGLKAIINAVIKTLQRLPDVLAALKVAAREILRQIARISDDAPPVFKEIKALILRITNLYNDVKRDVTGFYNTVVDTIQVILPLASDQLFDGVSVIIEAIKQLLKDPKKAIGEIQIGIFKISGSILLMLDAKHKIEEAAFFLKGPPPNWMNLKVVTASLKNDTLKLIEIFKKAASWVDEGIQSKDPLHHFTGTEIKKAKEIFYTEMKKVLEKVKTSIEPLNDLMEPFLKSFDAFVGVVRDIKETYETLRKAYTTAKDLIQKIFGPKFNKQFPKKYLESSSCGDGFYPSKGRGNWYSQDGIQVEAEKQLQVVAPFTGLVKKTGKYQVTITAADLKDTDIILENIELLADLDGEMVYTGELLGNVVPQQHCTDYHIHVVMRSTLNPEVIIDPTRYLNKRKIQAPKWVQHCNDYKFVVLDIVLNSGRVTGKPKEDDISPPRIDSPDLSDLPAMPKIDKKEITNTIISFGKTLPKFDSTQFSFDNSIPEMNTGKLGINHGHLGLDKSKGVNGSVVSNFFGKLKSILDKINLKHDMFNMRHVTIQEIFQFLNTTKKLSLMQSLTSILETLDYQEQISREHCDDVASLDIQPLKDKIVGKIPFLDGILNGKKESSADNSKCSKLFYALPQNNNKYCQYSESCLTIACCMNGYLLNFLRITLKMKMSVNPCSNILSIGIDNWKYTFNITNPKFVGEGRISPDKRQLNIIGDFEFKYIIQRNRDSITVSFALEKCKSERCDIWIQFLNKANMSIPQCSAANFTDDLFDSNITTDISKYFHLTLGEVEEKMDLSNMNAAVLLKLMKDIRNFQNDLLRAYLVTALSNAFENDFNSFDICLNALTIRFGPHEKNFFSYSFTFMVGPIPISFGVGASGHYGIEFRAGLCLLTHKLKATVTPAVGASVSASLSVGFLIYGELRLTGYILTIKFPTTAEIGYKQFPFEVKIRMDMELIPLRLELAGLCTIKFFFIRVTVFKALIWEYTATSITKNIFNHNQMEPDTKAPKFSPYRKQKTNKFYYMPSSTTHCFVEQMKGRDYTDPAFLIEIDVEDDKSDVSITLCVGTVNGGCDVLRDEPLAGSSVIISAKLVSGVPLHFTITARDAAGGSTKATCRLQTYDSTLPNARLIPSFMSTSHPNIIHGSATFLDDSPILIKKISVGFGPSMFGDQLIPWQQAGPIHYSASARKIDSFTDGRHGRLLVQPIAVATTYSTVEDCAAFCIHYSSQCLSFNYEKNDHSCEILHNVENDVIHLRQQGDYYYYERTTINSLYMKESYSTNTYNIISNVLKLKHNELIYINAFVVNQLGYSNYISSAPIITDFTPPGTGPLGELLDDRFFHDTCSQYIIEKWRNWCKGLTPLKNHRIVIDGKGAATIFNGQERMIDLLYTRANTFLSCNWDGFHDNETGILGYSWAYGTNVCEVNILHWSDPHHLLYDHSQWTHKGLAYPLDLPDGKYYLSIEAYNQIEFGGPLATTICHSVPLAIDNTPPNLQYVGEPGYDEHSYNITMDYLYSDTESHIRDVSVALGKSTHDTLLMDWETEADSNDTFLIHPFKIPDGIPAWIKIRAANNVDLRTSGHAYKPILVDMTPPLPGYVFDGKQHGIDIDFQNNNQEICVNWDDFGDPESAIGKYAWGVGSSPGLDDIINFHDCPSVVRHSCDETKNQLIHNESFYSTVIAFNNGHVVKNVSITSNGVLYDATAPIMGWIYDGLDRHQSMKFSSDLSTVSANWNNYSDPESGIKEYNIQVYQRLNTTVELLQDSSVFSNSTTSVIWHTFHLKHGDNIFVVLNTTNQALSSLITSSEGYTIDMTDPILIFLGDGNEHGINRQFSASTTELVANYEFEDPESGIDHYRIMVFEMYEGFKRKFYPEGTNSFISVASNVSIWKSEVPLPLKNGALYSIRVSAYNGAGMSSVHNTDGVIIDPSSPIMEFVQIGVMPGEAEDLIDDFVMINDQLSVLASWRAIDPESGIFAYWISVGTSPGGSEVSNYRRFPNAEYGYIDKLNLELFNNEMNLPFYYITVKSENGAGLLSEPMISSKIKVVEGDIAGIVSDGPYSEFINGTYVGIDIDYQLESTSATTYFHGFRSVMHGIISYEWAVGTQPQLDDIQEYSSYGIVVEEAIESPGQGISGSGRAQSLLHLQHGQTYYITVRAITGLGKILESVSDGFIVDTTASMVNFINLGTDFLLPETYLTLDTTHYQKSTDSLNAAWNIIEEESEMNSVIFYVGSYPGASNILNVSNTYGKNSISNVKVQPLTQIVPNIISVVAENKVGLKSHAISGAILVDITPPITGVINCTQFIRSSDEISCFWHNFYDFESGIKNYIFSLGFTQDDDIMLPAIQLTSNKTQFVVRGLTKQHHDRYLAKIIAINGVGLTTTSISQQIIVDDTPPQGQKVIVLSTSTVFNASDPSLSSEITSIDCKNEDCNSLHAVCQKSLTDIKVVWEPFIDLESPVIRYEVAVGISPGGTQISGFNLVKKNKYHTTISNLDLSENSIIYVSIKGYNAVNLPGKAISSKVFISHISYGMPPLGKSYVNDGSIIEQDIDFQHQNDYISAHWNFSGDPCPIVRYEWSILKLDGSIVQNMTLISGLETSGTNDELNLYDGESYFVIVKSTNWLGYTYSLRSNGVTIMMDSLLPGNVRDGEAMGIDVNVQKSITSLSANWDGFGEPNKSNQVIDYYEVAAGNDQRYPGTRINIHPFINVGLNTTWSFNNLILLPRIGTYYITVRAYSITSAMAQVTSNGVQVGFGGKSVTPGVLELSRFINSASYLIFSWSSFESEMPILWHIWGMSSKDLTHEALDCNQMQVFDHMSDSLLTTKHEELFNVSPLTKISKDTIAEGTGLALKHGETYDVIVIGTDEAAMCNYTMDKVTVDLTPPVKGKLKIGPYYDRNIMFSKEETSLTADWIEYYDPESGIESYEVSLFESIECPSESNKHPQTTRITDKMKLHLNTSSYTFIDMSLKDYKSYFVHLVISNGAGTSIEVISSPIIIDLQDPIFGDVKDGTDITNDETHQSSTDHVEGVFVYLDQLGGEACKLKTVNIPGKSTDWKKIVQEGIWGLPMISINLQPEQIEVIDPVALSITLRRDQKPNKMISGAIYTSAEIDHGSIFEIKIKAAGDFPNAVTSVVFWDGPDQVFGDHEPSVENIRQTSINKYFKKMLFPSSSKGNVYFDVHRHQLSGVTESLRDISQTACGFQLHPNVGDGSETLHMMFVWCQFVNHSSDSSKEVVILDFDPVSSWHTYSVHFKKEKLTVQEDWSMEMFVDEKSVAILTGIPKFSQNSKLVLNLWNRNNFIPEINDVFVIPQATAYFKDYKMPGIKSCRHASPFRNGKRAIQTFYAGVGSENSLDDVMPFTEIAHPCIPCINPCDSYYCDPSCDYEKATEYHVNLTKLHLNTSMVIRDNKENDTYISVPALYFLTVKAETGSGRSAVVSSNGIVVDVTPPMFKYLYALDLNWSADQPLNYQTSNSSITAKWAAFDLESDIISYQWAIGTLPRSTDIQDYISVGLSEQSTNDKLLGILQDKNTYYITVKAINGAHLDTYEVTDVTVSLSDPNISNTSAKIISPPHASCEDNNDIVFCYDRSTLGVIWDRVPDDAVNAYYFGVGSSAEKSFDVIPERLLGINKSETVIITDGQLFVSGESISNISDLLIKENSSDTEPGLNTFSMEPGRVLYIHIKACTMANKCGIIPVKPVIYFSSDYQVATKTSSEDLYQIKMEVTTVTIQIEAISANEKVSLMAGILKDNDLKQLYASDASNAFKPFISNPWLTVNYTSRSLLGRIKEWLDINFFISTLHEQQFNILINLKNNIPNAFIQLLYWDTEREVWDEAECTCASDRTIRNASNIIKDIRVCQQVHSVHYALASLQTEIVNSPPIIITTGTITLLEDSDEVCIQVEAYDPDGDVVQFLPETHLNSIQIGFASLTLTGYLCFIPFPDLFGTEIFYFRIIELRNDSETSLFISGKLTFDVLPQNDNPVLMVIRNGIQQIPTIKGDLEITLHNEDFKNGFQELFVAYDVDYDDLINILISKPKNGYFVNYKEFKNVTFTANTCLRDSSISLFSVWTTVLKENSTSLLLPYPCNWNLTFNLHKVVWAFTFIHYIPNNNFTGIDIIRAVSQDKEMSLSNHRNIKFDIIYNPCQNGGYCEVKKCLDINCIAPKTCVCKCRKFYTGSYCEIHMCPGGSGLYPNPLNCATYYQCTDLTVYIRNCPVNLVFNPKTKNCDYPNKVPECKDYYKKNTR